MTGEQSVEQLSDSVLKSLSEYLGAHAGAFFVRDGVAYRRVATYGAPRAAPESFGPDDGLLGQAVKDRRTFLVDDLPDGYLTVGSALGQATPPHVAIVPASIDADVKAVFELGFSGRLGARRGAARPCRGTDRDGGSIRRVPHNPQEICSKKRSGRRRSSGTGRGTPRQQRGTGGAGSRRSRNRRRGSKFSRRNWKRRTQLEEQTQLAETPARRGDAGPLGRFR